MTEDKKILKIVVLISLVFHVAVSYWLFTNRIATADLSVKDQRIITVKPMPPGSLVFYDLDKKAKKEIVFAHSRSTQSTPGKKSNPAEGTNDTKGTNGTNGTKGSTSADNPFGSFHRPQFSLGSVQLPEELKFKEDFLLGESGKKLIVNPFNKVQLDNPQDFSQYLYSIAPLYGGTSLSQQFGLRPGSGNGGEDEGYKEITGRIDFNVTGLNISPWAKEVVNKLVVNWRVPPNLTSVANQSMTVGVQVTFEKSGALSAAKLENASPFTELNNSILTALKAGAPYPELPNAFPEKNLTAYLRFNIDTYQ